MKPARTYREWLYQEINKAKKQAREARELCDRVERKSGFGCVDDQMIYATYETEADLAALEAAQRSYNRFHPSKKSKRNPS